MTAGQSSSDDEYEERAAIREFDGGFERFEANQLALIDLRKRKSKPDVDIRKAVEEQQQKEAESEVDDRQGSTKKKNIEQLRQKAKQVRKRMLAATDPQREKELFTEWMGIYSQIVEIKKGV